MPANIEYPKKGRVKVGKTTLVFFNIGVMKSG